MRRWFTNTRGIRWRGLLAGFCLLSLAACEGDPRVLQEAVLASNTNLSGLTIAFNDQADAQAILNIGEQLQFSFSATNLNGQPVSIENNDRRWISSNTAVGTVSDSGIFIARGNGTALISLRIGGIFSSNSLQVTVSNAELVSIARIAGPDTVSECSSPSFTAIGSFSDGSERSLSELAWQLAELDDGMAGDASIISQNAESATIAVRSAGTFRLQATQDGFSTVADIPVVADLATLEITPLPVNPPIEVGQSIQLLATANSSDGSGAPRAVGNVVRWSLVEQVQGSAVASVQPAANGVSAQLLGLRSGAGTLLAVCGSLNQSVTFTVDEARFDNLLIVQVFDNSDTEVDLTDGEISIAQGEIITVTASGRSDGGGTSERRDITAVTDFRVIAGDDDVVDIELGSEVEITGEEAGTVTIEAAVNGDSATFQVTVN